MQTTHEYRGFFGRAMVHRSPMLRIQLVVILSLFGSYGNENNFGSDALQYESLDNYSTSEECALVLNGPGRSSAYDYTYNLLRGSSLPSAGSHTCITYDAVNRAYVEARKRVRVAQPHTDVWRPEDLATVGELLLDISTTLAQAYGLTYEEIQNSLPHLDTSKTHIREICPAFLSDVQCRAGKYRRYDGLCTNLENPTWGSSLSPFTRLLNPAFPDGLTAPRISVTGGSLPLARVVSRTMHPDEGFHDHAGTVMVIAWGQFMDHDYTLTATPLDPMNRNDPEECCHRPPHQKNPYCNEIIIPEDDYFYRLFGVKCMDFVRAFPGVRPGCRLGSRVPFNLLTGVLDGNTVYGISETFSRKLRTGYGGLLRMNPVFSEYGLKDLLPLKLDIPDEGCTRPNRSMYCFEAGEIRVNEQLVLTCMHTLVAREHNRAAKALSQVNPHWDDETTFQEARRIVIAQIQHITYNEFLPILLGKDVMEKFGLLLEKQHYWDGYDPTVNPGVIDAFAAAAFRFGHSLLPTAVERWSKAHKFIASKRLSDLIRRPYDLYRAGVLDEYLMGLMNQVAQAMDDSITQEVTNHLFKKVGARFGMDLVSFNMQRGREFGIPSYMEFRKFCGLPGADTFEGLFGSMPNETIRRYSSIFRHPSDVDLWSGGVSERPLPGSMLGPTFACVIATQFSYSRRGDRFWYELPNQPSSFTLEQLNEIRKSRLARLICDNTDLIDTIQLYPMVLPDHEINPRVPCRSGVLPGIDFSKWADYPATSHAAQYSNNAEYFLPLPILHAERNKVGWIPVARNKIPMQFLGASMPKIDSTRHYPKDPPKFMLHKRFNDSLISGKFINYLRPRGNDRHVLKVTTIVEIIRKRFRRHTQFQTASAKLLNRRKSSKNQRRLAMKMNIVEETRSFHPSTQRWNRETDLRSVISRRHRRSTLGEDRQKPWTIIAGLKSRKTWEENRKNGNEVPKLPYAPKFKECNDTTAASEVEDLNVPLSALKNRKIPIPFVQDIDFPGERKFDDSSREINDSSRSVKDDPKIEQRQGAGKPQTLMASPPFIPTKLGYVNLRDYQEQSKNKNRSVPIGRNASSASLAYPKDIKPYNPDDIPYVEVPDYTDQREESLDEEDRRVADKERYRVVVKDVDEPSTYGNEDYDEDIVDPDKSEASDVLPDPSTNQGTSGKDDKSESITDRYKDTPASGEERSNLSTENPVDSNYDKRTNEEQISLTKSGENLGNRSRSATKSARIKSDDHAVKMEEETKNPGENNEDPISDFQPVNFEFADYIKPFDFRSLFENNQTPNGGIVGQLKEGDESESLEIFSKRYKPSATTKPKDFYFDDKEFFKPILEHKKDKYDRSHDDFFLRYFDDDVTDKLRNDEEKNDEVRDSEESLEEEKDHSYETLPTIVKTNNVRSKIGKFEARKEHEPGDYSKFWTLEYASPFKKQNHHGHTYRNEKIQ